LRCLNPLFYRKVLIGRVTLIEPSVLQNLKQRYITVGFVRFFETVGHGDMVQALPAAKPLSERTNITVSNLSTSIKLLFPRIPAFNEATH
jgi:hypothetical protein